MNALQRVSVAGLLGMWVTVCWPQEATEENAADAQTQQEADTRVPQETEFQVRQEAEVEGDSPVTDATAEPDATEQAEAMAVTGQTVVGAADGSVSLNELFVPQSRSPSG